jgi:hypothetical protein
MYYQDVVENNSMDVWRRNSARGRKDVYHEEEFICNSCRFDHKDPVDLLKDQENSIKTQLSTKIIILEN